MTALCSLLMVVPMFAPAPRGDALYGVWEPRETSRGGLGAMAEFTPDGKFIRTFGALVRGRYVADSTSLVINPEEGGEPIRMRIRLRGDALIQYAPAGPDSIVMTRVGPSASGMRGDWTYTHYTKAPAFMRFRADSTVRLWVRMRSDTTPYELRGDTIVTQGAQPMRFVYRATESTLELRSLDNGKTQEFTRDRQ